MKFEDAFAALCPDVPLFAKTPKPTPPGPFAVCSVSGDSPEKDFYVDASGHRAQVRRAVVLLNVWGGSEWTAERLHLLVRSLREGLADQVTAYPTLPPLAGVRRGPHNIVESTPPLERPMFWMRLELTYLE